MYTMDATNGRMANTNKALTAFFLKAIRIPYLAMTHHRKRCDLKLPAQCL
jgi:hypothetical protein